VSNEDETTQIVLGDTKDEKFMKRSKSPMKKNRTSKIENYEEDDDAAEYGHGYPKLKEMSEKDRVERVLHLWRSVFNTTMAGSILIQQKEWLVTKVNYFGRQMISDQENKEIRDYSKPKWYIIIPGPGFLLWQLLIVILLLYFATYIPYEIAFLDPAET
jgi:hypothetical protein